MNIYLMSYFYKMSQFFLEVLGKVQKKRYTGTNCLIALVVIILSLVFIDYTYTNTLNTLDTLKITVGDWPDTVFRIYILGTNIKLFVPITISSFIIYILTRFHYLVLSDDDEDEEEANDAQTDYFKNPSLFGSFQPPTKDGGESLPFNYIEVHTKEEFKESDSVMNFGGAGNPERP